mgnify:CR=1 FL=1
MRDYLMRLFSLFNRKQVMQLENEIEVLVTKVIQLSRENAVTMTLDNRLIMEKESVIEELEGQITDLKNDFNDLLTEKNILQNSLTRITRLLDIEYKKKSREFYVFRTKQIPYKGIQSVDELRNELLINVKIQSEEDFTGWSPGEYTIENVAEFRKKYRQLENEIKNGSLDKIKEIMKRERFLLTWINPIQITDEDFEIEDSPIFFDLESLVNLDLIIKELQGNQLIL